MRFLNHHSTYNSDVTTCACLKRTPATINITNHGPCQKKTARKSTGGKPPCLHLAIKAAQMSMQKATAVRKPRRWRPGQLQQGRSISFKKQQISSSGKPPSSVLYKRLHKKSKRVTCKCRAQLFWLSRRLKNTS
jgi:hypothetical protein